MVMGLFRRLRNYIRHLFVPELPALMEAREVLKADVQGMHAQLAEAAAHTTKLREALGGALQTIGFMREESTQDSGPGTWRKPESAMARDFREAQSMGGSGPSQKVNVKESQFWELELAIDSLGWVRQFAISQTEFSRWGLQQIILMCRLMSIKNPLIKRGVELLSIYVYGRGVDISCKEETTNDELQKFLKANHKELGHVALVRKLRMRQTDGNLFWVFFSDPDGSARVRTIDPIEVMDIIFDPEDCTSERFFLRKWTQTTTDLNTGVNQTKEQTRYYPAIGYEPTGEDRVREIGSYPVMWDTPVFHVKDGGLEHWKFGIPRVYAAVDYAKAVKNFLDDWATIMRALARFAWDFKTEGGQQAIAALQQTLATTLLDGGNMIERNPPPVVGSAYISGPKNTLNPVKTAGSTTGPEECRRLSLMVCAALGIPETMLWGDATTGSLATAQSLDRPTELLFLNEQEKEREMIQCICVYALSMSKRTPGNRLREADTPTLDIADIRVEFPAVLEHSIKDYIDAFVAAVTLNGYTNAGTVDPKTAALLIQKEFGLEDAVELVEAMYPDASYDPEVQEEEPEPEPDPNAPQPKPGKKAMEAQIVRAAIKLSRYCESIRK
jgi:hypothetical protein